MPALLVALLLLAGCASSPSAIAPACISAAKPALEGQFALDVSSPKGSHQLLVVSQWRGDAVNLVGFNAVGARLFSGTLENGQLAAEASRLYRGPNADLIMWGLLAHQLRDHLPQCWDQLDYAVSKQAQTVRLQRNRSAIFFSPSAAEFQLPAHDISVQVNHLN